MLRLCLATLLTAALAGAPLRLSAQTDTNAPPAKAAVAKKATGKKGAGPFHGKLAAVDTIGKTITIGTRTFQITPTTLLFKDGKPATLSAGVLGENASGYFKTGPDGKLNATKVTFGTKPAKAAKAKSPTATPPPLAPGALDAPAAPAPNTAK